MKARKINHNLGDVLRKRRVKLEYSQLYMAAKLGITQNAYAVMERAKADVTVSRLKNLADILETTVEDLLGALTYKQ